MSTQPLAAVESVNGRSFSFAFQPIVDATAHKTVSYEALVRSGPGERSAVEVFGTIAPENLSTFDAACRKVAVTLAARLGILCNLNLNLVPQSVADGDDVIAGTLLAARANDFDLKRIVLEITENVLLTDHRHFAERMQGYRGLGMKLAMDDFGSGYSGLNLLASFQPDQIKLDQHLVRRIESRGPRQAIVRAIVQVCHDLNVELVAEGVETLDEYHWFCDEGVHLFQGFLFARPVFESLPQPHFPGYALNV